MGRNREALWSKSQPIARNCQPGVRNKPEISLTWNVLVRLRSASKFSLHFSRLTLKHYCTLVRKRRCIAASTESGAKRAIEMRGITTMTDA